MSVGVRNEEQGGNHHILDLQHVVKFNFSFFVFPFMMWRKDNFYTEN